MTHRVVVLGAGAGGLSAANRLGRHAGAGAGVEVVLVDRSVDHVFVPGFVAAMFGEADPDELRRPLAGLVRPAVRLVTGSAHTIDPDARIVIGEFGELAYDSLVVALGAAVGWPDTAPVPEAAPWTPAGVAGGRDLLARVRPDDRVVVAPATPTYRCPPAVFDLAVRVRRATGAGVTVAHPWPRPLAPFGEEPARRFEQLLARAGVDFRPGFTPGDINSAALSSTDGEVLEFDAAIVVPPHLPPEVVAASPLAGEAGWMAVTYPNLCHPAYPEVAGVGDVVAPSLGVGMAGSLGVFEGAHVADRIAAGCGGPPSPTAPQMGALCFVDPGTTGSLLHCDFTGPASGGGPARCTLLPDLPYFRRAKALFAQEWFTSTVWGDID